VGAIKCNPQSAIRNPQSAILLGLGLLVASLSFAARVEPAVERQLAAKGSANIFFTLPVDNPGIFFDRGAYIADKEVKAFTVSLTRLGAQSSFKASYRVFNRYGWGVAQIGREDLEYLRDAREMADVELAGVGKFQDVEASQAAQIIALATGSPAYNGAGVNVAVLDSALWDRHPALVSPLANAGIVEEVCIPTPNKTIDFCPRGLTGSGSSQVAMGFGDIWNPGAALFQTERWPHATGVVGLLVSNGATVNTSAVPPINAAVPASSTRGIRVHAYRISLEDSDAPGIPNINEALFKIIAFNNANAKTPQNQIRVVNMSLGSLANISTQANRDSQNFSYAHCDFPLYKLAWAGNRLQVQVMWDYIRTLRRQGVVVVAATGNNYGNDGATPAAYSGSAGLNFPACLASVVSVSATWDSSSVPNYNFNVGVAEPARSCSPLLDRNACYTQRNWLAKVAAPGSFITSAWMQYRAPITPPPGTPLGTTVFSPTTFTNSNNFYPANALQTATPELTGRASHGTSFSTPLVSACIAQILQAQPNTDTAHLISLISGNQAPPNLPRASAADASSTSAALPAHFAQSRDSPTAQQQDPYRTPLLRCQELLTRLQSTSTPVAQANVPPGLKLEGRFGLTGSWFDPKNAGQGFVIEVNPQVGIIFGGWYTFTVSAQNNNTGLSWYTIQSAVGLPGSTRSFPINIYRTNAAALGFNANPTPNPNMVVKVGEGTIVFQSCTQAKFTGFLTPPGASQPINFDMNLERLSGIQRCANDDLAQSEINQLIWRSAPGTTSTDRYGEFGMRQYALSGNWSVENTYLQGLYADIDVAGAFPFIGWYTYSPTSNPDASALPSPAQPRWFSLIRAELRWDNVAVGFNLDNVNPLAFARMRYAIYRSRNGSLFGSTSDLNVPVGYVEIRPISTGTTNSMSCNKMQMIYKFATLQNGVAVLPPDPPGISPGTQPIALGSDVPAQTSYTVDEEFAGLTGVYNINRLLQPGPSYCFPSVQP
jgi:hypothetical protein